MKKYIAIASALLLGTANSCLECGKFALNEDDLTVEAIRYRELSAHPIFTQNVHEVIYDDLLNVQAASLVEQEQQDVLFLKHLRHQLKTRIISPQVVRQNIEAHGLDINDSLMEAVFTRKELQLIKQDQQSIKVQQTGRSLILDQIYGHMVQSPSPNAFTYNNPYEHDWDYMIQQKKQSDLIQAKLKGLQVALPEHQYSRTIIQDQFLQVQGEMNYKKKLDILKRAQEYIRSGGALEKAVRSINKEGISLNDPLFEKVFNGKEQKLLKEASENLSVGKSLQSSEEQPAGIRNRSLLLMELYPSVEKAYFGKICPGKGIPCGRQTGFLSEALYYQDN